MRQKTYTSENVQQWADRYREGEPITSILPDTGVSMSRLYTLFRQNGIALRTREETDRLRYPLQEQVFDSLEDDPEGPGAYWCGLLMADGCVGHKRHPYVIALSLTEPDANHVLDFQAFLGAVRHSVPITPPPKGAYNPARRLSVVSPRLTEALARYGVVAGKTLTAKVSLLQHSLAFWRGFVCGDGSLWWTRGIPALGVSSGSPALLDQFVRFVEGFAPGRRPSRIYACGKKLQVSMQGRRAQTITGLLFPEGCPALPRKYQIARDFQSWQPN